MKFLKLFVTFSADQYDQSKLIGQLSLDFSGITKFQFSNFYFLDTLDLKAYF